MEIEKHKKSFFNITDDRNKKIYQIHHMHHFKYGEIIKHELHHCFLFTNKNKQGKKYSIIHELNKNDILHCINGIFEGILYDHQNNNFHVLPIKLNNKIVYEIRLER